MMVPFSAVPPHQSLPAQGAGRWPRPWGSLSQLWERWRPLRGLAEALRRPPHTSFTADLIRWTFLFWLAVYILFTVRSAMHAYPHLLLQAGLRMLTVGVGACISWMLVLLFRRVSTKNSRRVVVMLAAAAAANLVYFLANYAIFYVLPGVWNPPNGAVAKILSYLVELFWLFPSWVAGYLVIEHRHRKAALPGGREPATIWAIERGEQTRVPVESILWVESEGDYVRLHTSGRSYLIRGTLRAMEERLAPHGFLRIHRRLLVDASLISKVRRAKGGQLCIVLADETELPIGRSYVQRVRELALSTH